MDFLWAFHFCKCFVLCKSRTIKSRTHMLLYIARGPNIIPIELQNFIFSNRKSISPFFPTSTNKQTSKERFSYLEVIFFNRHLIGRETRFLVFLFKGHTHLARYLHFLRGEGKFFFFFSSVRWNNRSEIEKVEKLGRLDFKPQFLSKSFFYHFFPFHLAISALPD